MQVLPQCGHAVHEDAPDKVGELRWGVKLHKSCSSQPKYKKGPCLLWSRDLYCKNLLGMIP